MRTLGIVVGVVGVTLAAAVLVRGQPDRPAEPPRPRTVTASGSATVRGTVDSARLTFRVNTTEETVPVARTKNAGAVKAVREAVAALKVDGVRVRTTDSYVSSVRSQQTNEVTGFVVAQSLSVVFADADPARLAATAERVLDAGLANGVNADGGVEFFRADDADLRREAMRKAVEDALESAKAYAGGARVTVAEVLSVEEFSPWGHGGFDGPQAFTSNATVGGAGQGAPASFSAGAWQVTRRVRVVCRY